ncbi:MAG TPA: MFS transporter [Prolixibacteraceae bacterium]|nr:MFS transporter [Prolixibacteraceae bacterium]
MGFVDVVGIASNYIKQDFMLSDTSANLLLMMVFVWFVLFSIPTGVLMGKIGRKKTVLLCILITAAALFVPVISYNLVTVLVALSLLGIGNTMLQVSLNPLLSDIVPDSKLASSMTFGQFVKSISSFIGPVIAGGAALYLGNWRYLFPLFGGISILAAVWLSAVKVTEPSFDGKKGSFSDSIRLLGDRTILGLFIGILLVVGIDVGLNVSIPKLLMLKTNMPLTEAGLGSSLYFAAKTAGAFIGAVILVRISASRFYTVTVVLALISLAFTLLIQSTSGVYIGIFLLGLTVSNIFSIIFFKALLHKPAFRNEISGLMMMGIIGGALVPLEIGIVTDSLGLTSGMLVLGVCMIYLLANSLWNRRDAIVPVH